MKPFAVGAAILALHTLTASTALAHARLERSSPPDGAILSAAPSEVSLWFSEPLEPAFSTVDVVDAAGTRADNGDQRISGDDPKQLLIGLKPLGPGTYRIIWSVLSVDTHRISGEDEFTVKP